MISLLLFIVGTLAGLAALLLAVYSTTGEQETMASAIGVVTLVIVAIGFVFRLAGC